MWLDLKSSGGDCEDLTAVFPVVEDCNRNSSNLSSLHTSKVSFFQTCLTISSRRPTSRISEFESTIGRDSSPPNISLSFKSIRNLDQSHIQMLIRSTGILDLSTIDIRYSDDFPANQANVLEIYRPAQNVKCMSIPEVGGHQYCAMLDPTPVTAGSSRIEDGGGRSHNVPFPNLQELRLQTVNQHKNVDFGQMLLRLLRRRKELQSPIQNVAIEYYKFSKDYIQELRKIVPQVTSKNTLYL